MESLPSCVRDMKIGPDEVEETIVGGSVAEDEEETNEE